MQNPQISESDDIAFNRTRHSNYRNIKTHVLKTHEDPLCSETSTPSVIMNNSFCSSRYKSFSSNFSNVSLNLVDSIRKPNRLTTRSEATCDEINTPRIT